jgi:M6 family metalloprotease-like protein
MKRLLMFLLLTTALAGAQSILPNTFGQQNVLIILVNFQDLATQPWTTQTASSLTFGTGTGTVNGFYQENSFGQTWLTGDVAGWYTIPVSSTSCNTSSIQTYAQQAAQSAGYVLSNYTRFIYAFPQTSACSWSGWSNIGGNPSQSWINGNMNLRIMAHELGHAFGLYHSHALSCTSGSLTVPYSSNCSLIEYGDQLDDMGSPQPMDFNASQKERLGWLNYGSSPPITTVTASGSYSIAPYETQDGQSKALKVQQSSSSNSWYYLESRQFIGDDIYIQSNAVLDGIVFHLSSPSDPNSSDVLDMEPSNGWGFQAPALEVGYSYTDSGTGAVFSPISVTSTGATVQVTLNSSATCTSANPTISVTGPSNSVAPGATANFSVSVKNNDNSNCSSSTFNLSDSVPSGWSGVYSANAVTLAPGASTTATLSVTSPSSTPNGTYTVNSSVDNSSAPSYAASTSASDTIYNAPPVSLSVSTDKASYSASQTVTITATVLSGSSPDAGASVSVSVSSPKGNTTTLSGTTSSNGTVVFSYTLRKKATTGTYQVQASTTASGASTTTAANTTFSVQ